MNKAQPGLSLIEVLFAVLMLGISVTTLFSLQGVLSRGVFSVHATFDRIPFVRNFFVQAEQDKLFTSDTPQVKIIEYPALRMTYSAEPFSSKAVTDTKLLRIEKIEAQWSTPFGDCKETFAKLRFVPQVEGV